ncbi:MAG TPA: response regulator [Actinocrinis sp.]
MAGRGAFDGLSGAKERILLVDDQESNLVALEAILSPLGKVLVRAKSGPQALKLLLREDYAVVLLDVVMPGMDGFETATHIKLLDKTRDLPIIFLTGADDEGDDAFRGYAAGAVDYLTKPFDPWVLRAKVQVFIELHRGKLQLLAQAEQMRRLFDCVVEADRWMRQAEDFSREIGGLQAALAPRREREPGSDELKKLSDQLSLLQQSCGELVHALRGALPNPATGTLRDPEVVTGTGEQPEVATAVAP